MISDGTNSATYFYLANSPLINTLTFKQNTNIRLGRTNSFDNLNRLTALTNAPSADSTLSFNYAYNSANQRTAVTNADSSRWAFQYDLLGQVTFGKKYWSDGTIVAGEQFEYGFDGIGNRTYAASGGDQWGANLRYQNYTVNNLNQYTQRTVPGTMDVIGSATNTATVTVNKQATYRRADYFRANYQVSNGAGAVWQSLTNLAVLRNGTNADITATNIGNLFVPQTPEAFLYDADGNLTNDGRWTFSWDAENRLTNIVSLSTAPTGSKRKLDLSYDYLGRRTQKIVWTNNGSIYVAQYTNKFVYDGWNLVAILDGGNGLLYSFRWGSDLSGISQGAGGVGGLVSMTVHSGPSAGTYFYAFDANGNVGALINAADGTIAAQYEYGPFGEMVRATGLLTIVNPFRFSTKLEDAETGFVYYGLRYYDPNSGAWRSRDALGEDADANLYGFNLNDALNRIDTLGGESWMQLGPGQSPLSYVPSESRDVSRLQNLTKRWRKQGWDYAAAPLEHFLKNNGQDLNVYQYHAKVSKDPGWRQEIKRHLADMARLKESGCHEIGDKSLRGMAAGQDLRGAEKLQVLFNHTFGGPFDKTELFYALYHARFSYFGSLCVCGDQ